MCQQSDLFELDFFFNTPSLSALKNHPQLRKKWNYSLAGSLICDLFTSVFTWMYYNLQVVVRATSGISLISPLSLYNEVKLKSARGFTVDFKFISVFYFKNALTSNYHSPKQGKRGSSVGKARYSWSGGPWFDPRCDRPLPTGSVGVSIMWPAETEVMVSPLCFACGST